MTGCLSKNAEETREIGCCLAEVLKPDGVLLLNGDLGVGKTVLVQGVAAGLGMAPTDVQSPSYTLIRQHDSHDSGGEVLIHIDLYRLEADQLDGLGLDELMDGPGVKVVEWAERLTYTPPGSLRLELRRTERDNERVILMNDELRAAVQRIKGKEPVE